MKSETDTYIDTTVELVELMWLPHHIYDRWLGSMSLRDECSSGFLIYLLLADEK